MAFTCSSRGATGLRFWASKGPVKSAAATVAAAAVKVARRIIQLLLRVFVQVIGDAGLDTRGDPLEVILSLQGAVNVLRAEQEAGGRLHHDVARGVVADVVV